MFIADVDTKHIENIPRSVVIVGLGMVTEHWEAPFHSHDRAQLLFADTGLITLETEQGVWVVPPQGAVWIPSGIVHRARCSGQPRGFVMFVEPDAIEGLPTQCCTLAISPFLRALFERIAALPEYYDLDGAPARLVGVLLDELIAAPVERFDLPMPEDLRLRKLTDRMLANPAERLTLLQRAEDIGMSERNVSRLFSAETGLTVNRWRQQMHIITALPLLAQGQSIEAVAEVLGYESASAFVAMFRKAVGTPPRRFLTERSANLAPLKVMSPTSYQTAPSRDKK